MLKLVIVDDEPSTRLGLQDCFDWRSYGVEIVGLAENGKKALPMIAELTPDLVLTDVKMPFLDGISLAGQLKQQHPEIKVVFISGYDDLEYLKFALKIEAVDYLLKPINFEELDAVMRKVTTAIRSTRDREQLIRKMGAKLLQSMPLLKEKFFAALIQNPAPRAEWVEGQLQFLELDLPADEHYCILVLRIDDYQVQFGPMPEKEKQLSSFAVLNICQEMIDKLARGFVFETFAGEYVCVLNIHNDTQEEQLLQLCSEIKKALEEIMKLSVTIGVSRSTTGLTSLSHAYRAAQDAANLKLYLGKNQIITMESLETKPQQEAVLDPRDTDKFVTLLKAGSEDKTVQWLDNFFHDMVNGTRFDLSQCQRFCLQLLMAGSTVTYQLDMYSSKFPQARENQLWEELLKLETVDDMKANLKHHFTGLCRLISNKRVEKSTNVVEQVKSIILDNLHINLSLNDIASRIYLTTTYICLLFKQETGETIIEFMTRVKIDKARELLLDSRYKLYEVSLAVGYADSSYFTKLFKKYTGLTPSEYRNTIR